MDQLRALARGTSGSSSVDPLPRSDSISCRKQRVSRPRARKPGQPRLLPLRPGVVRRLRPLHIAPEAQESVAQSSLTEAELRSVKAPTLKAYGMYDGQFRGWCRQHRRSGQLESKLLEYVTFLLTAGAPTSSVECVVNAVLFFNCTSTKHFPRLQRALRGVRHTRPHRSRVPLAEEIVASIVAILIVWGLRPLALMVLLATSAYLRPGETRSLRAEDVLPPSQGRAVLLREWSLFLRPEERGEPTKTGTWEETIYLDYPVGLGEAIGSYAAQFAKQTPLFPFQDKLVLQAWKSAAEAAGVGGAVLYQLRHAGASGDLLAARRTLPAIQGRGRWKTSTNCRRYSKSGQVQRSLARLSANQMALGIACLKNLDGLLLGTWQPPPHLLPSMPRKIDKCRQALNECIMKVRSFGGKGKQRPASEAFDMPVRRKARRLAARSA